MRRIIKIVTQEEYQEWLAGRTAFYMDNVRGTDADPRKGKLLDLEIRQRAKELSSDFSKALSTEATDEDMQISLKHVFYNTGSAALSELSNYELDNLASLMKKNSGTTVELQGHTDSSGDDAANMALSQQRAQNVRDYLGRKGIENNRLVSKGYGETVPVESNDTEEGRAANRRTELRIISK